MLFWKSVVYRSPLTRVCLWLALERRYLSSENVRREIFCLSQLRRRLEKINGGMKHFCEAGGKPRHVVLGARWTITIFALAENSLLFSAKKLPCSSVWNMTGLESMARAPYNRNYGDITIIDVKEENLLLISLKAMSSFLKNWKMFSSHVTTSRRH